LSQSRSRLTVSAVAFDLSPHELPRPRNFLRRVLRH